MMLCFSLGCVKVIRTYPGDMLVWLGRWQQPCGVGLTSCSRTGDGPQSWFYGESQTGEEGSFPGVCRLCVYAYERLFCVVYAYIYNVITEWQNKINTHSHTRIHTNTNTCNRVAK